MTTTHKRRRTVEALLPYFFILPAIVLTTGLLGYAIVSGFITSLYRVEFWQQGTPFVGLQTYVDLFATPAFQNSLMRSLIFVAGTVGGGLFLSLAFALTLSNISFGKSIIRALVLIPYLVSGIAAAVMWRFLFSGNAGFANNLLEYFGLEPLVWLGDPTRALLVAILAEIWFIAPFAVLILLSGLQSIDPQYYEAASIDGAVGFAAFRHITVPLLSPMIATSLVWISFASFNSFAIILALTGGGPGSATEVLAVYMYRLGFGDLNYSSASAVMMILLLLNVAFSTIYLKVFKV